MKKRIAMVIVLLMMFFVGISQAASVTLAWDANVEPDLKGYTIYYGVNPGDYSKIYIVSDHPELLNPDCGETYDPFKTECCEITIPNLALGNNYFAATAYDEDNNESAYSEELVHFIKASENTMKQPKDFEKIP